MKVTMRFPISAKKHILTQRGNLRPEIVKDLSLLISGRYEMGGSAYDSRIDNPEKGLTIEITEESECPEPPQNQDVTASENVSEEKDCNDG